MQFTAPGEPQGAVNIKITVYWDATWQILADRYMCLRGTCCFHKV